MDAINLHYYKHEPHTAEELSAIVQRMEMNQRGRNGSNYVQPNRCVYKTHIKNIPKRTFDEEKLLQVTRDQVLPEFGPGKYYVYWTGKGHRGLKLVKIVEVDCYGNAVAYDKTEKKETPTSPSITS